MTIGLLSEYLVLRTKTAFEVGDVVVAGDVEVVTSGAVVVSAQELLSQGHPAGQFT